MKNTSIIEKKALAEAKKYATDEKIVQLLVRLYVSGYKAGVWDTSEEAIHNLLENRNKTLGADNIP